MGFHLLNWIECGIAFFIAIVATMAFVPFSKYLAHRFDAIDYPSERRINRVPIPRLGGVAIFLGIMISFAVIVIGVHFWGWRSPFHDRPDGPINYGGAALSLLIIFLVGFIDDVFDLPPKIKLLGQIIAATIAAFSGILLSSFHNPIAGGYVELGWLAYPITIFYLVAFANIINLIDGLDGLASGISAISSLTIFILSMLTSRFDAALFAITIAGACIGFLRFNFHPASIFMGDSGALLLGFLLGSVSLVAVARSAFFTSLLVPIIAAGVPIIDTASSIIRRVREHKPIDRPDSDHIHHRLIKAGFDQRTAVLIMWAWTAVLAICGVLITLTRGLMRIPFFIIILGVTIGAIWKLHLLNPVLVHHYNPRERSKDASEPDQRPLSLSDLSVRNHGKGHPHDDPK